MDQSNEHHLSDGGIGVHTEVGTRTLFFIFKNMEAVFLEIGCPNTLQLVSDDAKTRRMCRLKPQVGIDAAFLLAKRVFDAALIARITRGWGGLDASGWFAHPASPHR